MVESTGMAHEVCPSGSGRRLTPEEAEFLKRFLLDSDPVVVEGVQPPRKKGPVGVPHLPLSKRAKR